MKKMKKAHSRLLTASGSNPVKTMSIKKTTMSLAAAMGTFALSASSINAAVISIDPTNNVTNYISLGEWETPNDFEGWSTTNVANASVSGGSYNGDVVTTANDPQPTRTNFSSLAINLDSGNYSVVEVRISRTGTASRFDLFWGTTTANSFSGTRKAGTLTVPSDGNFHIIQFDMSAEASWESTLDDMRIDPFSDPDTAARSFEIDYVRVGQVGAVPEPGSALLSGLAAGLLLLRRRR